MAIGLREQTHRRSRGACGGQPRRRARELYREELFGKPVRIAIGAAKLVPEGEIISVIVPVEPMMGGMAARVIDDGIEKIRAPSHAIVNHHGPKRREHPQRKIDPHVGRYDEDVHMIGQRLDERVEGIEGVRYRRRWLAKAMMNRMQPAVEWLRMERPMQPIK